MEPDTIRLKEIKPALTGYIHDSQILLRRAEVPDDNAIHDIRVLMKKARALLKIVSPQLEYGFNDKDIDSLREIGRIMREWREKSVHRKTLKQFRKDNPDIFSKLADDAKLNLMLEKQEAFNTDPEETRKAVAMVDDLLTKTGYRIRFQNMNTIDPQLLLKELETSYKKVVNIYLKCRNNPKPESLHNFRKKSKDFLYQLYIFKPLNPSKIKSLEKKLDDLTQNLGKFNDISQIISDLGYKYKENANPPAMDELLIKLHEAQDGYLTEVWPVAYPIFCPGQNLINVLGFKLLVI